MKAKPAKLCIKDGSYLINRHDNTQRNVEDIRYFYDDLNYSCLAEAQIKFCARLLFDDGKIICRNIYVNSRSILINNKIASLP
jgi:hypothetical protein